jgi:hypothetical protein
MSLSHPLDCGAENSCSMFVPNSLSQTEQVKYVKRICYKYHSQYNDILIQLPPSIKKEIWLHLTTRKRNPLSEEEASTIHPEVEKFLLHEVERYVKKKDRSKIRIAANSLPDGLDTLTALDKLEC